jgi:hypothetical protein
MFRSNSHGFRYLDCCSLLQLSAPQPAVDNRSELERAFNLVIRQQAAAVHQAGGTFNSPCWTFPDGRDSIRSNPSGHIPYRRLTVCLFCSVETACRGVSRRNDRPTNRWLPRDLLVDEPPSDF